MGAGRTGGRDQSGQEQECLPACCLKKRARGSAPAPTGEELRLARASCRRPPGSRRGRLYLQALPEPRTHAMSLLNPLCAAAPCPLTAGPQGHGHRVGNLVDAVLHLLAGGVAEQDVLGLGAGHLQGGNGAAGRGRWAERACLGARAPPPLERHRCSPGAAGCLTSALRHSRLEPAVRVARRKAAAQGPATQPNHAPPRPPCPPAAAQLRTAGCRTGQRPGPACQPGGRPCQLPIELHSNLGRSMHGAAHGPF